MMRLFTESLTQTPPKGSLAIAPAKPKPSEPTPFFPQQKHPQPDSMLADLRGELVVTDGCIRINDADGYNVLPIWPYGFSLQIKDSFIQILDATGQVVAQVGDTLEVSGGEMPAEHIAEYSAQPIPGNCPGPYWIVGHRIKR